MAPRATKPRVLGLLSVSSLLLGSPVAAEEAAAAKAVAACDEAPGGGCLGGGDDGAALIQTKRAMGQASASASPPRSKDLVSVSTGGGVLIPPFIPPEGAEVFAAAITVATVMNGTISEEKGRWNVTKKEGEALIQRRNEFFVPRLQQEKASASEWQVYELTKELRQRGFRCPGGQYFPPNNKPFEFDCRLWKSARLHSEDMAQRNYFAHVTPEGKDPFDRSAPYGLPTFFENLAAGRPEPVATMDQWKSSDAHCKNMMKESHTRLGVGYGYGARSTYKHYWGQLFADDDGAVFQSCYPGGGEDPELTVPEDEGCSNKNPNCGYWSTLGYCDSSSEFQPYMHDVCKEICGICGDSTEDCTNKDDWCDYWAGIGYCETGSNFEGFMADNCPASCRFCLPSGQPVCEDGDSNCDYWAGIGYCDDGNSFQSWMFQNCKLSCNRC